MVGSRGSNADLIGTKQELEGNWPTLSRESDDSGVPTGLGRNSAGSTLNTCSTSPSSLFCKDSCGGPWEELSGQARRPELYVCGLFGFGFCFLGFVGGFQSDSGFPARKACHISRSFLSGITRPLAWFAGPTYIVGWFKFCKYLRPGNSIQWTQHTFRKFWNLKSNNSRHSSEGKQGWMMVFITGTAVDGGSGSS